MIITPAEFLRDAARLPRLRRALRARGVDPDAVPGLSVQAIEETLRCLGGMGLGGIAISGFAAYAGGIAAGYPWDGNPNVAAVWIADAEYITLAGSDVASWTTQQAYTRAGAETTYTLAQGDSGLDPEWEAAGLNSKGSILFDGIDEFLRTTNANFIDLIVNGADTEHSVIALMQPLTLGAGEPFWIAVASTGVEHVASFMATGSSVHRMQRRNGANIATASTDAATTNVQVFTDRFDGTDIYRYRDDTLLSSDPQDISGVPSQTGIDEFHVGGTNIGLFSGGYTHMRIRGLWVVINDDTDAIQDIEDWALSDGGIS